MNAYPRSPIEAARVGELQRQVALGLQAPCAWAAAYPRTLLAWIHRWPDEVTVVASTKKAS